MANILRYNPADFGLDDFFRGFFVRPLQFEGQQGIQIKMLIPFMPKFPARKRRILMSTLTAARLPSARK